MPGLIRFSTLNRSVSGTTAKAYGIIGYDGTVHRSSNIDSCTLVTIGSKYLYDIEFTAGVGLHESSTFMIGAYSQRRNVTSYNANMGLMHGQLDIVTPFSSTTNIIRVIRRVSGNIYFTAAGDGDTNYTLYNPYDLDHAFANAQPEYIYIVAF